VNLYLVLAVLVLALHLGWILWVMLGWLLTRGRPVLRWLHIGSLLYGIGIEVFLWPCPLTWAEQWLEQRAGRQAYRESFVVHYIEGLIYPDVSPRVLLWGAVTFCVAVLGIYVVRFLRRTL
jgi:hypothetical protein